MNTNPFFEKYDTPFGVPPFDKINNEHYLPAFEKAMQIHNEEVEAILSNEEEPTFKNTIVALDKSGKLLSEVAIVFYGQASANINEEIQKIQEEISPRLSAHGDQISLDPRTFARIKTVYKNRKNFDLNAEESFLLESKYMAMVRNGAELNDKDKEKLKEYNSKLSSLKVQFDKNVLSETNSYKLVIKDEKDLSGLPASVKEAALVKDENDENHGKWVFTTQKPSMIPFLQYADNRELRQELYYAYTHRANNDNDFDNKEVLAEMVETRANRAGLLTYKNHSSIVLEPRMAKGPENVNNLLDELWGSALPTAKKELAEMQAIADAEGANFRLIDSDWWYYAEKLRKQKYDLDDSELRPYFKLENVREAAFMLANKLYGISFTEITDIPKPHKEAVAFEVKEENGDHLGVLYLDFHPRASKRQGAWCGSYRDHRIDEGKEIQPVVTMVMNFTRPGSNTPALLSLDEVETLFHEFGHALDGLFCERSYNAEYIAWDFVELPSQIMEHWATEPEMLKLYAKHYETGENIPDELIEKIKNSSFFNTGFTEVEYLAASYLDIAYHTIKPGTEVSVAEFEKQALDKIGLIPEIESRYRSTYFNHISGGYDSGYYSYKWAAVLDHDAFEAFKESGDIFNREIARSFRYNILAKNGIEDAMQMYINFRGREPNRQALLKNLGFLN